MDNARDVGAIDRAYTDASVDMVLAVGFLANQLAVTHKTFEKPTFLPLVINAELMGAPVSGSTSGIRNLSYLVDSE